MSVWLLVQVSINLALILGLFSLWNKFHRSKNQEDPRLSRGLQLLQSKIAILEDLSDRTEVQCKQLTALLNNKAKEIHDKVEEAERQVRSVDKSISKSMEVSKIFQDKIPHEEIIERQTTAKYIDAARMAHGGATIDDIAKKIDIPRGELDLIVRMNRQKTMFNETNVPEWAKQSASQVATTEVEQAEKVHQATQSSAVDRETNDIRERLKQQSAKAFVQTNVVKPQPKMIHTEEHKMDFAMSILEEEIKADFVIKPQAPQMPKATMGMKKSSIIDPASTEIKPYVFKTVNVKKP